MVTTAALAPEAASPARDALPAQNVDFSLVAPGANLAPRSDLSAWEQVFVDDFRGTTLGSNWRKYSGVSGNDPHTDWETSQASVGNGVLTLTAHRSGRTVKTGGVSLSSKTQRYGKYVVRMRVDKSDEMKYAVLLWPDSGWPPEIDFAEDGPGDRSSMTTTFHYGLSNTMKHDKVSADFTAWHEVGVEWSPGRIAYTLDGRTWATRSMSQVPSTSMWLAIQQQAAGCTRDSSKCDSDWSTDHRVQVDWVAVYARR